MIGALRRLRPLKGWRAFWGEVGIIVLGVLIALVIGQAAQAWQDRQSAAQARASIAFEIGDNVGAGIKRGRIQRCIDRRLDEIQRLLAPALAGQATPSRLRWVGRPQFFLMSRTRLDAAAQAGRASLLTIEETAVYAHIYGSTDAAFEGEKLEQAAWARLRLLDTLPVVTPAIAADLAGALQDARLGNWRVRISFAQAAEQARALGISTLARGNSGSLSVCLPATLSRAEALRRLQSPYPEP